MGHLMDMGWAGWAMMLLPVLVIVAIIVGVVWMLRRDRATERAASPLETLQQRYARGEVGQEEFDRMRASLTR
ncbi:MAG: SHOCT domain-containing protein [Solirubrobacteraceae bacterium]